MPVEVPEQWSQEVVDKYEPVRILGKGGFGSVVLAKRKQPEAGQPRFVAIKVVGSKIPTRQEVGYAHRELDILRELNHPNIMKVIEHWEPKRKDHLCAAIMILSYSKGPTLEHLLLKGGALSLVFGRVVCAQLVDTLSYLHSRAVLHRDIKPDNLIITGATYEQNEIWDEIIVESEVTDWGEYRKKWHITLVDFGFARALTPSDMAQAKRRGSKPTDSSLGGSSPNRKSLSKSISRVFHRQMSALGNRNYAAPEIMRGVKPNSQHDALKLSNDKEVDLTGNLAPGVSSYGMVAEAFSTGNTIRFAMTGVPPNKSYNEATASQNGFMAGLGCLFGRKKKTADAKEERKPHFRKLSEVPGEAQRLIKGLTESDVDNRTTIRTARKYPWIDDVLDTETPSGQEVEYLSFALKGDVDEAPPMASTEA